jgi:hypothetical protein
MLSKTLAGALGAGIFALGAAGSAQAATFTVNDVGNSGGGTLRSAIIAANNTAAKDTIKFDFAGSSVRTITPTTPLPVISEPVKINGYTHADADPATDTAPAAIKIVLDAVNLSRGLDVGSDDVEIRGLDIQNAQDVGIWLEGSDNVVAGNYIGTGVNGNVAHPNANYGVQVFGQDNRIGGPNAADRNVISSNGVAEVFLDSGSGDVVEGNYIGTDAAGLVDLGVSSGVNVETTDTEVRDNLVSGENTGVNVYADDNVLQGNKVGTDVTGTVAVENFVGINVIGADDNLIGGTAEGQGNLISGNDASGVQLLVEGDDNPAERNDVQGNLIGTNAAGDARLGNGNFLGFPGVLVSASKNNTVGGTAAGAGNVISGNKGPGVQITNPGADNNKVLGNSIGTDVTGALDLGNEDSGVEIAGNNNRVGDISGTLAPNTIVHNDEDGVTVLSGTGNAVLRNSIDDNRGLAIDLADDGATANDANDIDTGANNRQNGPEIQSASSTDVEWSLDSDPTTDYRLEFYANDTCSAASVTEAQTFLGSVDITTDANGNRERSTPISLPADAGPFITMTATRMDPVFAGPLPPRVTLAPRSTSEVSPCEEIS